MITLNALRSEIAAIAVTEQKLTDITHILHVAYYEKNPSDRRAIDRTRDDYPLFFLVALLDNKQWE